MVEWISNWAEAIILSVIIATIIEMILPEGSSKKYIKVVIGVYILFTIISPVISNFTGKSLAVSDILDLDQYINDIQEKENSQNILQQENENNIRDIYIENLKVDMKNKLKGKGYIVTEIGLEVGYDENYTLNMITISAIKEEEKENKVENIEENINTEVQVVNEINISVSDNSNSEIDSENKNNLSNSDKNEIKEYLSSVYEINKNNIIIN